VSRLQNLLVYPVVHRLSTGLQLPQPANMVKFILDDEYGVMMATDRTRARKKHKV